MKSFKTFISESSSPVQKPISTVRLGTLPRDIKEDLFNLYAMFIDPDATEREFYLKRVPAGRIDVSDLIISSIPDKQVLPYVQADPLSLPPIVIADGRLIDGQHRIAAARRLGIRHLRYIDVTGLVDTDESGFISEIPNTISESMVNPKFRQWFRGSKVKDAEGNPLVVYHGSGNKIDEFSYEFTGKGNDQIGSGFYFTTDEIEARGYSTDRRSSDERKLGGEESPTVHACYLSIKKPLDADKIGSVDFFKIKQMIEQSPNLEDALWNWGDLGMESKQSVIRRAAEAYVIERENIIQRLFPLANDFYDGEVQKFNWAVFKTLGYDGVVKQHTNKKTHYVAFFPSQIKSVDAMNFNPASDNIYD